jgi:polyhydroxybutyrate depolymerase
MMARVLIILVCVLTFCSVALAAEPAAVAVTKKITVDGLDRKYLLTVPKTARGALPVVVALHGGGSNASQMERYTKFDELAEREGFFVIYPDSIGGNWNDGRKNDFIKSQRENIDDVKFIRAAVDDVAKEHPIDRSRIFATGISNGGIMSHRLAREASDLVAAIAPVAASMTPEMAENFQPKYPVSILVINGDGDPIVPFAGGDIRFGKGQSRGRVVPANETVAKYVQRNGNHGEPTISTVDADAKDGTSVEIAKYPDGPGGAKTWFYRVAGGGHTWPGRPLYLPESVIGKASQDFSATDVIWQFFKTCPPRAGSSNTE